MRSCSTLITLCFTSVVYAAIGPRANLFIENKFIHPDGFSRSTVLAGASLGSPTFPGPIISGKKGDTFNLNVVNRLTNTSMLTSTSIHWHGLFQEKTAWADGPVGVTQCPIIPGNSFDYQFTARDQAGTFWYHSHYSTQYCDGLRGALVVYDPNDPYKYLYDVDDDSTVITLADWYNIVAPILEKGHPVSNTTLINGLGRNPTNITSPLAVISVKYNKRYRFRLVSISCDPSFIFSIDNHNMTIIEVDGINVKPLIVDSIEIFAGQRYSFILQANQYNASYWIRAEPSVGPTGFNDGINSAILLYDGAHDKVPNTTQTPSVLPLLETNLHPLTNPAAPGPPVPPEESNGAVLPLPYNISFRSTNQGPQFLVNNVSFIPPTVPVLLQIISGVHSPHELLPNGSIYTLPPNKVIEITIGGGGSHPIHLHGHAFSVIKSAGSTAYNYKNPVRRDVVNSGNNATDPVVIRFETDNAGPWIMHCHIDWHLELGLAIVMAENIKGISQLNPPVEWDKLCPLFDNLSPQTFL